MALLKINLDMGKHFSLKKLVWKKLSVACLQCMLKEGHRQKNWMLVYSLSSAVLARLLEGDKHALEWPATQIAAIFCFLKAYSSRTTQDTWTVKELQRVEITELSLTSSHHLKMRKSPAVMKNILQKKHEEIGLIKREGEWGGRKKERRERRESFN